MKYDELESNLLYRRLANCIRVLTMDAVEQAKSGHPGMPLGMADVATVLFSEFLNFVPSDPKWLNRDRFILSAGHGSMLLYSLLYLTGYSDITLEDLKSFRQLHSKTAGHPEYGLLSGIETTSGPLGQGLANAVGMEIARNISSAKLGTAEVLDHNVFVIVGDGCLMEGISHEACSLAGHLGLKNLIVLYDSNNITIDGERSLSDSEDTKLRFQGYGWHTQEIDGHDFIQIREAIKTAKDKQLPSLIICKTKIAYGTPTKEGKSSSHGAPLGEEEIRQAKQGYGWPEDEKFFIPEDLLKIWRGFEARPREQYKAWHNRVHGLSGEQREVLKGMERFTISDASLSLQVLDLKRSFASLTDQEATRKSSGKVLTSLCKVIPFIGGSADLTESNYTSQAGMGVISKNNWNASYIHYGIREHAMGAIMNGLALYGGAVPYGGSFLVFTDYLKPAIRMAAIMQLPVIYVMTHDSIGVGEDGPTHQPIEQLGYLRSVPNVKVFRPADGVETTECWELAIRSRTGPSVLCLTRQALPVARKEVVEENLCALGAYIISEHQGELEVTIFATGSEVSIALEAQGLLHKKAIGTRVVSVPSMELLDQQDEAYKKTLLDNSSLKVAIEAAARFGWDKYIGRDGIFIGMTGFGASAPHKELYKLFGITPEAVLDSVVKKLNKQETLCL
jgi:transketolase